MPTRQLIYTPWQVLEHWWIGAAAFAVAIIATPIVRHIAYKTRIVDRPDDLLKPHGRPVAYLGGVAIFLGLLAGLVCYVFATPGSSRRWDDLLQSLQTFQLKELLHNPLWSLISIALGALVITIMGLLDDIRNLKPRQKVYWQLVAAAILVVGGAAHRMAVVFFNPIMPPSDWSPWFLVPISSVMAFILVVSTCNATNLLDGLDGLCGGVTAIIALGFLALAVWLAMWRGNDVFNEYNTLRVALCLGMAGAILGFLPYNIPPASIFMGDAGSMLLGYFVATMMALFCHEGAARWLLATIVVYSLPIADTALAVVRRLLSRQSIFIGDRSHLYDQLVDRGMSVKQVVVLFYLLAALAAVVGVVVAVTLRQRYAVMIYALIAVVVWVIFWRKGMIHPDKSPKSTTNPEA